MAFLKPLLYEGAFIVLTWINSRRFHSPYIEVTGKWIATVLARY
ncbi:hypothetical protein [Peribacillus butanolivorans]